MSPPRMTRRDFVNGTLVGTGTALLGGLAPAACRSSSGTSGPIDSFTGYGGVGDYARSNGNTFEVMNAAHRIRDLLIDDLPNDGDVETVDLVVVGGGPAGLFAAYEFVRLAGPQVRVLVLENHPVFGGAAKQNDFRVDDVHLTGPQASNDFGVPRSGSGSLMDRVFDAFGLPRDYAFAEPSAAAAGIRFARDNYTNMDGIGENLVDIAYVFEDGGSAPRIETNIWSDDLARTPWNETERRDLLAWRANADGPSGLDPAALDTMSYAHFLQDVKGFDPAVTRFVGDHIGLLTGLSPDAVSARVASRFVYHFNQSIPSFPGGNTGLVRPLVKRLIPDAIGGDDSFADMLNGAINFDAFDRPGQPVCVRHGATAADVRHRGAQGDRVQVRYEAGGRLHTVRARTVIMASGGWVNRRILGDMPDTIRDAYAHFLHAPVLVANLALTNWRFLHGLGVSAARWFSGDGRLGFCGNIRQPMIVGDRTPPLDPDRPALFTLYIGLTTPGEADAAIQTMANRSRLFETSYGDYEATIIGQMVRMFGGAGFDAERDVAGLVLNRWGHARLVQPTGFLTAHNGASPLDAVAAGYGRIHFAHSELNGAQNVSGAFARGARAAEAAAAMM